MIYASARGKSATAAYKKWIGIISRCRRDVAYASSKIAPEWMDFSVFEEWFNSNVVDGWEIDKDVYGNGVYSDKCIFLPKRVNLVIANFKRANYTPYFGTVKYADGTFSVIPSVDRARKFTTRYPTYELAYSAYVDAKLSHLSNVLGEYPELLVHRDAILSHCTSKLN